MIEVPARRPDDRPAEHLVGEGHPGERYAARVRHPEGVGDRLPGVGGGRAGLHQDHGGCGSWIVVHRVVVLILDRHPCVIGRNSRHVPERERGSLRHRVRLRVDPDLVSPEHLVVPGVAARRPGDRSAKYRIGEDQMRERDVARVGDPERVGNRLPDAGRRWAILDEVDPRGCVERDRMIGGAGGGDLPEVGRCRRRVDQGVLGARRDLVRRGVDPDLIDVQHAIVIVAACRSGDVASAAENCVLHRHVPERYGPGIPDLEPVGDHLADKGRVGTELGKRDLGIDDECHGVDVRDGYRQTPVVT